MAPLLCACAVAITFETQKCRKGHLASSNLTFLRIVIDENGVCRMKEEGLIYKTCLNFFLIFTWGLSYDLSKFSDDFTPFFDFESP